MGDSCMTRRAFVRGTASAGAAAAGAAAIGATGALAGCGQGASGAAAERRKVLRFGQANSKQGLDMQKSTSSQSSSISDTIFETPLLFTEENELVPLLFTEVPAPEADGVTYRCTLKEGVTFHDGSALTADDVKFTFERMFTPSTGAKSTYLYDMIAGAKEMLAGTATELSGLKVEDDTHLTFTLTEPYACFARNLGSSYAQVFPRDACTAAGSSWGTGTSCVGTGPYKMESNDDTTEVVLVRNDSYHGDRPPLDEVRYRYFDDVNTKMLCFKNGDIDWCDLDGSLLATYQKDPDVKDLIVSYDTLGTYFVALNLSDGMGLEDADVRRALSLAIDRDGLVQTVLSGAGTPASGFLTPQEPGFDKDAPVFPYDPDEAARILGEKGAPSLTIKVRSQDQNVAVAIQDFWSKAGVSCEVNTVDNGVWAQDRAAGNLQVTLLGWFPAYADGDNNMYTYFLSSTAEKNSSFYNNPHVDELLVAARASTDEEARADMYKEVDDIVTRQDYAVLPLFYPKHQFVAKDYVENAKVGNLIYHVRGVDVDTTKEDYPAE